MGFRLNKPSFDKPIIQVENASDWLTISGITYTWDTYDITWLNVNIKYDNARLYTKDYAGSRVIPFKGNGSQMRIRLVKNGNFSGGSRDYVIGGLYPGGRFFVTLSANDERTAIQETSPTYFYTYTEPKLLGGTAGSKDKPFEFGAGNTDARIIVNDINAPVNGTYEYFMLRCEKLHFEDDGSQKSDGTTEVGNVSSLITNKHTVTEIISYADEYTNSYGVRSKPSILVTYGQYLWNINNYNTAKSVADPNKFDGKTILLRFYQTGHRLSGEQTYVSANSYYYYLKIYYRPRIGIVAPDVTYRRTDQYGENIGTPTVDGKPFFILNDEKLQTISISWNYNKDVPKAGYTQGYRVRLYGRDKKVVNTYYTTNNNLIINKDDVPMMCETYIDITPYYTHDSSNPEDYWYQGDIADSGEVLLLPFVSIITKLDPPRIDYPVEGSNWINNKFRVCFKLPEDFEAPYVEGGTIGYRYENIELEVNGKVFTYKITSGSTDNAIVSPQIFSAIESHLTLERGMIAFPNITNQLPQSNSYTIRVRVKRLYGNTEDWTGWSDWSEPRTFRVTKINYSVQKYDYILAEHFNNALNDVDRVRKTYGVDFPDKQANAIKNSTIIYAKQYAWEQMFMTTYNTKMKVNMYGDFDTDRQNVKFDIENKVLDKGDVLDLVWIPTPPIEVDLPEIPETILHVLPDIEETIPHVLPTIVDTTHYITALKDDELEITENDLDVFGISHGIVTHMKPGKNYIKYVEDNCDYLV